MRPGQLIPVIMLLIPSAALTVQGQTPLPQPGTRLRLTLPCEQKGPSSAREHRLACRAEGILVLFQSDTITLTTAGSTTSYGVNAVSRVDMSRGFRSHRNAGAVVGFLVGGGTTLALLNTGGSKSYCDRSANQDAISRGGCIGLTALGGLAGAGVGAIIGGFFRTERWQNVPLERLRVTVGPQVGSKLGLGLAVSL